MGSIKSMFNPKAIALIGANEEPGSVGRATLENLLVSGSKNIFPVNPKRKTVLGLECFPDIASVPEHVDLAVIVTPAKTMPDLVEECGKADAEGIIIISAGFKEIGEEGKQLEQKIIAIRKKYGMKIIGPNCIGVIRPNIGLNASFLKARPVGGNIAFISQSGALGSAIFDWAINAHIGFSMFASLGSMIDVDFGDLIDFLGYDYYTRSIILYMEGVGNAKKFMSAARGFARNKPIIIVKPGRFTESAKAARSHTGAMAGDDQVYEAAFKRVGVIRVKEFADLFNSAEVLDSKNLPKGRRLAIITNAGGFGVMATDALIDLGGELAKISDKSIAELNRSLPSFWSKGNPIDILGDADEKRYANAIKACIDDPEVDGILAIYSPQAVAKSDKVAETVVEIAKGSWKPVVTAWVGGENVQKGREVLYRNNIPIYETPEDAVKTYLNMYKYYRNLELLYETPAELPLKEAPPKNHLKAFIKRVVKEGRALLSEEESKDFLSNYGIPITTPYTVHSVDGAISAANRIRYPVVLKIASPDISHKSDVGGVKVGIKSDNELKEGYTQLLQAIKENAPQAKIAGVTVQKMIENIDYEIILGTKRDKDFGSVILFGMGGIGTEIFKDISIGLPPLNQTLARRLMEETEVFKMLQGYRGKPPADIKQLEHILVSFSNLIVDFPEIAEMDINPIAISDGKAYALDSRIIIDKELIDHTAQYPHLVITPYPTRYTMQWKLTDGAEVTLRPIRPEDEPLEHELLSTLSQETMRVRFFSIIKDITHEMLIRFCNIDYDREMAIVAELREGDKRKIIGIGRLIVESDFRSGEYAVLVHDDYHGKGLGYKLVDVIIGIAQDKGLEEIYGTILTENQKMLRVARKLGFIANRQPDGISKVTLTLK
ncbi:MAG: bifunctional acetate--CoA ligase family protein/GNAT family N-acetyltransferase [Proteobacteria bacterium]|nr:bifunctional acetate--CoA ligase family protein/GNAT family N-acetyltransferase [Pseudomonadota bacterium]